MTLLLALALGSLMPFAFSPYDHLWLAIIGLTGWAILLRRQGRGGGGFTLSLAFGFGWFGFGAWWLADTLHTYGHLPYAAAMFCIALVGLVLALFPALWGWAACRLSRRPADLLLLFPMLGIAEEWLRGHLFTGLPWTALGDLILDTPAVGWGAVVGVYGATLLPTLAAASLAIFLSRHEWRAGAAGLVVVLTLTLAAPAPFDADDATPHSVALVQPDIPQDQKWDADFLAMIMQRQVELSASAVGDASLIIWPEAAVPFYPSRNPQWMQWLDGHMQRWQRPVLFGGIRLLDASGRAQNGLYLFTPGSGITGFAGKQHLVPFGEYVPAWLPWLHKLVPDIGDFEPATDSGVLQSPVGKIGALICYESIFPEQARKRIRDGAEALAVVTNDAWYGKSPAAWQHFEASRMRAVETGRYVLRAANTGITGIIGPDGEVRELMPWWTEGVVQGTYRLSSRITPYVRWGDSMLLLLLVILSLPLIWLWRKR